MRVLDDVRKKGGKHDGRLNDGEGRGAGKGVGIPRNIA